MVNKKVEFQTVATPNAELAALDSFHNLGHLDGKEWFAEASSNDTTELYINIYTVDGLTGATVLNHTETITLYKAANGTVNIEDVMFKINGDKIMAVAAISYPTAVGSVRWIEDISSAWSDDGGATWSNFNHLDGKEWLAVQATQRILLGDVYLLGTQWFVAVSQYVSGTYSTYNMDKADIANTPDNTAIAEMQAAYAGRVIDDIYYFLYKDQSTNDAILAQFDGTDITTVEDLTAEITFPAVFDFKTQLYWKQGAGEIIMDADQFSYRYKGIGNWGGFTSSAEPNNGVIWGYNDDGEYILKYITWKDKLYKIWPGGGIAPIQYITWDGTVGFNDWVSNPVGSAIFQYNWAEVTIYTMGINDNLSSGDVCRLMWTDEPETDIFYIIGDSNETIQFQGFSLVHGETPNADIIYFTPELREGVEQDLKVKVTESYVDKTVPYILNDVVEKYGAFCWAGRGTDYGDVWTVGDTLTDNANWGIVGVGGTSVIKNLNVSRVCEYVSGANEDYIHYDYSTGGITGSVEGWIYIPAGATDNLFFGLHEVGDGARAYIQFDTSLDVSTQTDDEVASVESTYTTDTWIHLRIVWGGGDCSFYMDGVLLDTKDFDAAYDVDRIFYYVSDLGNSIIFTQPYTGATPFYTYNSISVVPTAVHTVNWKNKTLANVIKWADNTAGYTTSFGSDYQLYFNQMVSSGVTVSEGDNLTSRVIKKTKGLKVSIIELFGAAVDGKPLHVVVQGEGNFGKLQDRFTEVTTEVELLKTATQLRDTLEKVLISIVFSYQNVGYLRAGQSIIVDFPTYRINRDTYFISSNVYDAINDINKITAYSFLYRPWQSTRVSSLEQYVENLNTNLNDNYIPLDGTGVNNDYAKFTADGLEGRSYTEVKADLSLEDADINTLAVAAVLADDAYVKNVGDTMSGSLNVIPTSSNLPVSIYNPTNTNGYHGLKVNTLNTGSGTFIAYFRSNNIDRFVIFGNGDIKVGSGNLYPGSDSSQDLGTSSLRWNELFIDTITEHCEALPEDPEDWKDHIPQFLRRGKEGINVGMTARLALRESKELKARIEKLEGEIAAMMEIMGSYVDGINLLNEKILVLEERLNKQ